MGTDTDSDEEVRFNRTVLVFTVFGLMIHFGIGIDNCAIQTFQVFELLICAVDQPDRFALPFGSQHLACFDFADIYFDSSTGSLSFLRWEEAGHERRSYAQSRHTACTASSQCQKTAATVVDFLIIHYSVVLKFWEYRAIKQRNST
ncbi:Uncharacterised protein [Mycobacteroides abscessus subsp. massiliense]|nr:Uncharacterised protein [Mycobacteroides abscessus subsp. massiliense]